MLTICVPQSRCDAPHSRLYSCCFDMLIITAKLSNVLWVFESPIQKWRRRRRSGARKSFICAFRQHYASSRELRIKIRTVESAVRKCRFSATFVDLNHPYHQSFSNMPGRPAESVMPGITAMELPINRPSGAVSVGFTGTVLVSRWGTLSLLSHYHSKRPDSQFMPLQLDPRDS